METTWSEEKPSTPVSDIIKDKWADEDEDEDVKDNWDDEDEEETSEVSTSADPAKPKPPSKKKLLAMKIAEREALARSKPMTAEEEREERLRREKLQMDSDLELAMLSLGVGGAGASGTLATSPIDGNNLKTKEDFDEFRKAVSLKLSPHEKSPHYQQFLTNLFNDTCANLEPEDIKRLSSALNVLASEKQKAAKAVKGKKKPAGASLKVERSGAYNAYDDGADEFDDFM